MFLKSLVIKDRVSVVREISFHKGLNLILDLTSKKSTESGNDVGKTTLLRSIDYCLGSDGESIYKDSENKKNFNEQIYNYLRDSKVEFTLTLESVTGLQHVIKRTWGEKPLINGKEYPTTYNLAEFKDAVGQILFHLKKGKPTQRELIKKFIRIENYEMSNTIKFLNPSTSKENYEPIFLYLFGFENQSLLTQKNNLIKERKKLSEKKSALKDISPKTLQQMLIVIERDIIELEQKKANFQVSDSILDEVKQLENLRKVISELSISLSKLKIRYHMNEKTIKQLNATKANFDPKLIQELYSQAKIELPNIQKSFEEVVAFHQSMIINKTSFIQKSISKLEEEIAINEKEIRTLGEQEAVILKLLSDKGALSDLQKLDKELNLKYESRGEALARKKAFDDLETAIIKADKELDEFSKILSEYETNLEKRLGDFNLIFSSISKKLYEEEYILAYENYKGKQSNIYTFSIKNIKGNVGSGKKKGQTTAFDLAYLEFLNKYKSNMPRFVLHDHLEEVHTNQLKTLFEIANSIDGQYVVAILQDRIENIDQNLIDSCKILTLSENDKFFRI